MTKKPPRGAAARLASNKHFTFGKVVIPEWRGTHLDYAALLRRAADAIKLGEPVAPKDRCHVASTLIFSADAECYRRDRAAWKKPTKALAELALDTIRTERKTRQEAILTAMGPGKYDKAKFMRIGKALDRLLKKGQKQR